MAEESWSRMPDFTVKETEILYKLGRIPLEGVTLEEAVPVVDKFLEKCHQAARVSRVELQFVWACFKLLRER